MTKNSRARLEVRGQQSIRIRVADRRDPRQYRVGGAVTVSDCPWPALAAFKEPLAEVVPSVVGSITDSGENGIPWLGKTLFDEPAWLAGRLRRLHCSCVGQRYQLAIEGLDPLTVTCGKDGAEIRRSTFREEPDDALLQEAVLGPALLLALASSGTFALHASAVEVAGFAFAFLGSSGVGKSTLVRPPREPGRRIADDILPIGVNAEGGIEVRPWYPQLKVASEGRGTTPVTERLPLGGVFLLEGLEPAACDVFGSGLTAVPATIAVARHTVASRLFCARLLRRQLVFAATLARQVPVFRLGYERQLAVLPKVRRFVASRARALANNHPSTTGYGRS